MKIFIILSLLFTMNAFADPYLGVNYDFMTLASKEAQTKNTFKGHAIGVSAGYKISFIAAEGFYKKLSVSGKYTSSNSSQIEATINDSLFGLGARVYFLEFINFKGGLAFHNWNTKLSINGQGASSSINGFDKGIYLGAGARLPLVMFDLYGDFGFITAKETAIFDLELGLRYYLN